MPGNSGGKPAAKRPRRGAQPGPDKQPRSAAGSAGLSAISRYLAETRAPLTAAALTLPLLCIYGLGTLMLPGARNGADLLTSSLAMGFAAAGWAGWRPWASFYGALIVVNLGIVVWLSRRARFSRHMLPPLLLECACYAVLTGTTSDWLTDQVLDAARTHLAMTPLATASGSDPWTGIVISAGAGLHEELVFRLLGIGVVARAWLGTTWRTDTTRVVALALISSLVFAGVHHIAEPFTWGAMVFRTVAGLVFAALYLARGFAVAAWTHALYDVWILVVLAR